MIIISIKYSLWVICACLAIYTIYNMIKKRDTKVTYASTLFTIATWVLSMLADPTQSVTIGYENQEESTDETAKKNYANETSENQTDAKRNTVTAANVSAETPDKKVKIIKSGSNNSPQKASPIEINQPYQSDSPDKDDASYYKFSIDKDGYISLTFQHEKTESGETIWGISLADQTKESNIFDLESNGEMENLTSSDVRVKAGDYVVKIGSNTDSDLDYVFMVNFSEKKEEIEPRNEDDNQTVDQEENSEAGTPDAGVLDTDTPAEENGNEETPEAGTPDTETPPPADDVQNI